MQINFLCPRCSRENVIATGEAWDNFACEHCASQVYLQVSESIREKGIIDRCCICTKDLFYVQKDFNRNLGLAILGVGAVASIYTYGLGLLLAAALDWYLYHKLPEVTVCYFCKAIYRGYAANVKHTHYDLSIGELVESSIRGEH